MTSETGGQAPPVLVAPVTAGTATAPPGPPAWPDGVVAGVNGPTHAPRARLGDVSPEALFASAAAGAASAPPTASAMSEVIAAVPAPSVAAGAASSPGPVTPGVDTAMQQTLAAYTQALRAQAIAAPRSVPVPAPSRRSVAGSAATRLTSRKFLVSMATAAAILGAWAKGALPPEWAGGLVTLITIVYTLAEGYVDANQ